VSASGLWPMWLSPTESVRAASRRNQSSCFESAP